MTFKTTNEAFDKLAECGIVIHHDESNYDADIDIEFTGDRDEFLVAFTKFATENGFAAPVVETSCDDTEWFNVGDDDVDITLEFDRKYVVTCEVWR